MFLASFRRKLRLPV